MALIFGGSDLLKEALKRKADRGCMSWADTDSKERAGMCPSQGHLVMGWRTTAFMHGFVSL